MLKTSLFLKNGLRKRCLGTLFLLASHCLLASSTVVAEESSPPNPTQEVSEVASPATAKPAPKPVAKSAPTNGKKRQRPLVGWIEQIALTRGSIILNAKLDTGADYSSLHAHDIQEFEKDGEVWVRFDVTDRVGRSFPVEQRVIRTSSIKRMGGKHQRRNVIRMGICLGNTYLRSDINLVDRSDFKLQMLLGRNFLAGTVAIDPAISFTTEPDCELSWTAADSQK